MNLNKSAISLALTSILGAGTLQAAIIDIDYSGLFTMLDPIGEPLQNVSYPYYGDSSWGYGLRTQISGSLKFNTSTGYGTATVNPFEFFSGGRLAITNFEFQSIENNLMLGNLNFSWLGSDMTSQIILDAAGLFSELPTISTGDIYDASTCAASGVCSTPASDGIKQGKYPIGPSPISTTSFNTSGQSGYGTTLGQLSLGSDDGIGGSPIDNGRFSNYSLNIDFTSLEVTTIPIPSSIWLLGSGLLSLSGLARRRHKQKNQNA